MLDNSIFFTENGDEINYFIIFFLGGGSRVLRIEREKMEKDQKGTRGDELHEGRLYCPNSTQNVYKSFVGIKTRKTMQS